MSKHAQRVKPDVPTAPAAARSTLATYANGVRKVLFRDPDGNELGFGGAPLDGGS